MGFSEGLLRKTSKIGKVEAAVPVLIMMSQYVAEAKGNYSNWSGSDASKTLVTKLNAFLIKVNKNIDDLRANIKQLLAQIKSNSECVARETAIIKEAAAKTARNSDLKEKAIKMCAKFVEEVKEAQA